MKLSLYYFNADEEQPAAQKYRLVIEGAKFADEAGFSAVWTPERHFHRFGALFPNPALLSAALATITTRVQLRAGSIVLPLHHPVRAAEDWSVVDNLSNGRAAISIASGWNARDFVIAPERFADREQIMFRQLEIVQRLWAGEEVELPGVDGTPVPVRMHPRPIQPRLPVWVTTAGKTETWLAAGRIGGNILTHLVRQGFDTLAEKIVRYREARAANGHDPAAGQVTLLLHTHLGESREAVRARARRPLTEYLRTSSEIFASTRVAGRPERSAAEVDALLAPMFERYFESGGLFGTISDCLPLVERVRATGVNEIACLIDFGVDVDAVLAGLPLLAQLGQRIVD